MGNHVCLRGNVPASMLNGGTPDDVTEYSKKLIDVVGKNGGFMLDGAIGIPDEAKLEKRKGHVCRCAPLRPVRLICQMQIISAPR
jgi:uroporphyrinogen-III decarboxylase